MTARRVRTEHDVIAGTPGDVLALVAIAELLRRGPDVGGRRAAERRFDTPSLLRELRGVCEVLPDAAATATERRARRRDAIGARRTEPPHDMPPRLGLVRTGVIDLDFGTLARQ